MNNLSSSRIQFFVFAIDISPSKYHHTFMNTKKSLSRKVKTFQTRQQRTIFLSTTFSINVVGKNSQMYFFIITAFFAFLWSRIFEVWSFLLHIYTLTPLWMNVQLPQSYWRASPVSWPPKQCLHTSTSATKSHQAQAKKKSLP